ncbi:MAG: heparinase II/III family protein [Thermomicrobiales bacterium]
MSATSSPAVTFSLLQDRFPVDLLNRALPAPGRWHPYPSIADRDGWNALPEPTRTRLIAAGERHLGAAWPELPASVFLEFARTGNRTRFEDPHFARRGMLEALVLAECAEAQGRFLDDIINGIWVICEESFWGVNAHSYSPRFGRGLPDTAYPVVDLFAAETGALLAWIHALLAPAIRDTLPVVLDRIERELDARILAPYLTVDDWVWLGKVPLPDGRAPNNWNPWIHSNIIATTLLVEPDKDRQDAIVRRAIVGLDAFLAGYHEDGGCDEGTSYWGRAGASLFECLEWLRMASDGALDAFPLPLVQEIGRYIYRAHIADDWYVNFADGPARTEPDANLLYRYGVRIGDPLLIAQSAEAARHTVDLPWKRESIGRTLPRLFEPMPAAVASQAAPLILHAWMPGIQVLTSREEAGSARGLFLAAKGGHNAESHNHNDIGTFIVALDGVPEVVDVGVETYSKKTFSAERYDIWTMQSAFHNLPTIDGVQQREGAAFAATDVHGTLSDERDDLALDIAGAYPNDAGITRWTRTFRLERRVDPHIVVADEFELDHSPSDLRLSLMLRTRPNEVQSGLWRTGDGRRPLSISFDPDILHVSAIEEIALEDARLFPVWGGALYRMVLEGAPQRAGRWEVRFAAGIIASP